MKLQFKQQKFQTEAVSAVCDIFAGQPYLTPCCGLDPELERFHFRENVGWINQPIVSELTDEIILERIQQIQKQNQIPLSDRLEGKYNLTIEMETGIGKTYTYIKTIYELNKRYGWSKFVVVVPSVAIREGVYKSFQITQDHFIEEYGKKIQFFIYNSSQLYNINSFTSSNFLSVMIINAQAFNARSKESRRIYMELDEFHSRRPIDVISLANPVLIIDEPQSVEGKQTKERLKDFTPLFTLRYSATHKTDSIYNMIYRLDAMEAYNKKLVKKISVKGITITGTTSTESYIYLEKINLSNGNPTANLQFEIKGVNQILKVTRTVKIGYNLYEKSGYLEEYKDNFIVKFIDGRDNSLEFLNGLKLVVGDVIGVINEEQIRRLQIRETILSHLERERQLFSKGVKVLSLFFIDEVAKYRQYDETGEACNGLYAKIFEEEYKDIIGNYQINCRESDYLKYLEAVPTKTTHAGYFSIDKKGKKMIDSKLTDKKKLTSDDVDAYNLIMKDKEVLLDIDPEKSPVRFIFSHSALREGWDNPNVFQICTLKQSNSNIRKRQEVGRGLRLCVDSKGERLDYQVLGNEVHNFNVLTVIANESYDSFAKELQKELAEVIFERPRKVTQDLFKDKIIHNSLGEKKFIDSNLAQNLMFDLTKNDYIDRDGKLTVKYQEDKINHTVKLAEELHSYRTEIIQIIDSTVGCSIPMDNARNNNITAEVKQEKLDMQEFRELWDRINSKSIYKVSFNSQELVNNAIQILNKMQISKVFFKIESGGMSEIESRDQLLTGSTFVKEKHNSKSIKIFANSQVKYDLVGRLVNETGLTRKDIIAILIGIDENVFNQFRDNPEEFIIKAARLINEQKATVIIQHISYKSTEEKYNINIFTEPTIKGKINANAIKLDKHLYDFLIYDSEIEREFAKSLNNDSDVAVYVKLPNSFYISTPVGRYTPDWAIAFNKDQVKHIYFIAETKGSLSSLELRPIENSKIHCAEEHFKAISSNRVFYSKVSDYQSLLNLIK